MSQINYIKKIIDCWDPMNLLVHAPDDEYHSEIEKIEMLVNSCKEISELTEGIYQVFTKAFGNNNFCKSKSECALIAQKIISIKYKQGTNDSSTDNIEL